ncbi:MAG: hypothetical protein A2289_14435 [Deltaproteobacteria bacterium RIFOXYA12_FULL_58_15]|nr:MAG: hypothetical protein A2289_14435 [Deltaproteobacteria bacterium RIFOXYA12_FULL_58_15]OGR07340.1 MAG: hypothetical protein A2341_03205 [Deltaproteobacteria bacterium RIFOXYB12_FULL_58_9]
MLNIVLLTPCRRFIANRYAYGYQIPLGLVCLGGPLLDAGHRVRLIDNDVRGWDDERLAKELLLDPPDCIMIGHSGPVAAHPVAMRTARALKHHLPETTIVYGGLYATFAADSVMRDNPSIDIVVRGEGEATVVDLAEHLAFGGRLLDAVEGTTWRNAAGEIVANPDRPPVEDLDPYRPGWELVQWDDYHLFGFGRGAGMQFSRGCPRRCTYCGQWRFWHRWRHRSAESFVDQLEILTRKYGVHIVWIADENFAAERGPAHEVLELIVERKLDLSLNLNMTAAEVVRDRDLLPLYKQAGVDNIFLGIESLDDATVAKVGKDNPLEISKRAVVALRENNIVGLVNVIYGLQEERPSTLWKTFKRLLWLDPDVVNACHVTPYFWTTLGRWTKPEDVIQPDLSRFTIRNQVLRSHGLPPRLLFWAVKLTEALFHLRPRGIWRMLFWTDNRARQILRQYLGVGIRGTFGEILEFLFATKFVRPGKLTAVPGYPRERQSSPTPTSDLVTLPQSAQRSVRKSRQICNAP